MQIRARACACIADFRLGSPKTIGIDPHAPASTCIALHRFPRNHFRKLGRPPCGDSIHVSGYPQFCALEEVEGRGVKIDFTPRCSGLGRKVNSYREWTIIPQAI